jgi:hypothetical protein
VSKKKKYAQGARAIADTGATDHLFKERMELQNATKSLKRFWDFSGTKCIEASRQGIQHIYVFNPNDIHEPLLWIYTARLTIANLPDSQFCL